MTPEDFGHDDCSICDLARAKRLAEWLYEALRKQRDDAVEFIPFDDLGNVEINGRFDLIKVAESILEHVL